MAEWSCVRCGGALRPASQAPPRLRCEGCARGFPLLDGRIPVLVAEPEIELARLYMQHDHHLRRQAERAQALERRAVEVPSRADALRGLAKALRANAARVEAARQALRPYLAVDDVVEAGRAPDFIGYASTLEYLERDWCGLPEGEHELEVILGEVHAALGAAGDPEGLVVVLGAGAGRVAWELRRRFARVVAVDASLTMAQHFHAVLDGPVPFHAIATSSTWADEDLV
ncbi:MAG: hypothetical protein KDK70_21870, partial [Myxococcales bacterium]|nr:hypothetical protein [Myxococcales bacterium]